MSAGRAWATGTLIGGSARRDDDAMADARLWGLDLDPVEIDEADEGIWPENVPAVVAFLAVQTQWRVAAGAARLHYIGLDYAGVAAGLTAANINVTPELWADIRLIEMGARAALQERQP
jgi:hypothetical protein